MKGLSISPFIFYSLSISYTINIVVLSTSGEQYGLSIWEENIMKKVKDFIGNVFDSITEMCEAYGITTHIYYNRKSYGWKLKDILTIPVEENQKESNDHLGNVFPSVKEMCASYHIQKDVYEGRKNKMKWSLKAALETPVGEEYEEYTSDHQGEIFQNPKRMCRAYGLTVEEFNERQEFGLPLEQALTLPRMRWPIKEDHIGNKYDTNAELCRVYHINPSVLKRRLKKGWTLERALTTPAKEKVYDHLGNEYKSETQMCRKYGIKYENYHIRKMQGWDLKRILTTPVEKKGKEATDPFGKVYPTIRDMLRAYGMKTIKDFNKFYNRINAGWSLEDALMTK